MTDGVKHRKYMKHLVTVCSLCLTAIGWEHQQVTVSVTLEEVTLDVSVQGL